MKHRKKFIVNSLKRMKNWVNMELSILKYVCLKMTLGENRNSSVKMVQSLAHFNFLKIFIQ